MKVLLIIPSTGKLSGVDYHRMYVPHNYLAEHGEGVEYSQCNDLTALTLDELKEFNVIVCNRGISKLGKHKESLDLIKQLDAKLIVDMDDDYMLPSWHILYEGAKASNHTKEIIETLNYAYIVTCTHSGLADTLRQVYKGKIVIVPNCIIPEGQFKVTKELVTDRLVFGWSGSVTHFDDVMEMYDSLVPLYKDADLGNKFKFVYGGHDHKDIVSNSILSVLSAKGTATDKQFSTYAATGVHEYANFYDLINVMTIPLRHNRFNSNKSSLKMLESGFKKRACIVSPVDPYTSLIKGGQNCLTAKNKHDWYRQMVKLINNPELRFDLADKLYEDVQAYHVKNIAPIRESIYKLC